MASMDLYQGKYYFIFSMLMPSLVQKLYNFTKSLCLLYLGLCNSFILFQTLNACENLGILFHRCRKIDLISFLTEVSPGKLTTKSPSKSSRDRESNEDGEIEGTYNFFINVC